VALSAVHKPIFGAIQFLEVHVVMALKTFARCRLSGRYWGGEADFLGLRQASHGLPVIFNASSGVGEVVFG